MPSSSSTTRHVVPVVPWSIARITSDRHLLRGAPGRPNRRRPRLPVRFSSLLRARDHRTVRRPTLVSASFRHRTGLLSVEPRARLRRPRERLRCAAAPLLHADMSRLSGGSRGRAAVPLRAELGDEHRDVRAAGDARAGRRLLLDNDTVLALIGLRPEQDDDAETGVPDRRRRSGLILADHVGDGGRRGRIRAGRDVDAAAFSRCRPATIARPRTFGTRTLAAVGAGAVVVVVVVVVAVVVAVVAVVVAVPGPLETLIVTFEPLSTSLPAGGFCANTVPFGRVEGAFWICGTRCTAVSRRTAAFCWSPTTDGTTTGFTPLETPMRTTEPFRAVTPGSGAWSTTVPFGWLEATRFTFGSKPAAFSCLTAACCGSPPTSGTAARTGPFEIVIGNVCPWWR